MAVKPFLDAFVGITLPTELKSYITQCMVENIYMNKEQTHLYIDASFEDVIHPGHIEELEKAIATFINNEDIKVSVSERFTQGEKMSVQKIFALYQEGLIALIKKESPFGASKLSKISPKIEGQTLTYSFDTFDFDYLKNYTIDTFIAMTIKQKFNQDIQVIFESKEVKKDIFSAFIKKRDEEEQLLRDAVVLASTPVVVKEIKPTQKDATDNSKRLMGKKPIAGVISTIDSFSTETDKAIIEGYVLSQEVKITRSDKALLMIEITDFTDSIMCKAFMKKEVFEEEVKDKMEKNMFLRIEGRLQFDTYQNELTMSVLAMEKIDDYRIKTVDEAPMKRVELHCHTQMSDMDGVSSATALVKRAKEWGHKAIAITDHGVVQAFPEAFHAIDKKDDFKIIYGVEGYIVDDLKDIVRHSKGQSFDSSYVVFDIETTGFYAGTDKITEIGAVKIEAGVVVDRYATFVNPERSIPMKVQELTGIDMTMVKDAPTIEQVLPGFLKFAGDSILVAHNADFDLGFIEHFARKIGLSVSNTTLDTLELGRIFFPDIKNHKLNTMAKYFNVPLMNHHRAVDDAEATSLILLKMIEHMKQLGLNDLKSMIDYADHAMRDVKKLRAAHGIILVKNLVGLRNLYELISESHLNYFYRQPKIPKSLYNRLREGLIIGTACEAGELYKAVLEDKPQEEIDRLCDFYDYYEIQPLDNNAFLVRNGVVESKEQLRQVNRRIVELGEKFNKPVVATCDVHFLDPEDEVFRRILMAGKGFDDADEQAPLYLRTTEEMLREFSYLGKEKALEVVVTNTNLIADKIEKIAPVPPEKYPPVIEGSDEELRSICYTKAVEIYGEPIPEPVVQRLERELGSIISNGFAVMYIIAQKLVWKSMEDGYLVGSRGSVGSSFAATMAGITEVNPLAAHYICEACKYSDFDGEEVKAMAGNSGCNMPDKDCPKCGNPLTKEGHDIPFETFLGFDGDKEPDIDLNFSGEYQSKAHDYTEELFGRGHVFRAGTIGTLAEKTAFGYVKKYFDERQIIKRMAEINRLVKGCTGVRRTSGQHPGGIIVVPKDQSIYKFTPVQRPANDMTSTTVTTHFDYHSIDHNLLKLDILGHDDPTMIRMLEDLTGVNAQLIRLDEPKVMSLFTGLSALNIKPEDIGGCQLGSLGIPEFGTDFVMQMLRDTQPKSFSDLVRISGLSHGTDVWLNNAQELVRAGKCNISEVISTRDDIMTYLINQGVDKGLSFTIMESVRRGRGLKPEWEEAMTAQGVPDWYIWSCKQIKYMFPKAHAVAYVMMAYRIAYFKVYHKEAYYATYFSIRASDFDYESMCHGKAQLEEHMKELSNRDGVTDPATGKQLQLSKKEKDTLKDMRIVQEMYARGITFLPIDLYKVDAKRFGIYDGQIMPSLSAIQGLGEKVAENIVLERNKKPFISMDDMRERTKISKTVIEIMKKNGILDGLPESNQLSLFI